MHFPSVFDRVRMTDRDDQFIVIRVDHFASVVDLCPPLGRNEIERNVPFSVLHEAIEPTAEAEMPEVVSLRETLHSSFAQLASAHRAVAEVRELLRATEVCIRGSQRRIEDSDALIARAGFPYPRADDITG